MRAYSIFRVAMPSPPACIRLMLKPRELIGAQPDEIDRGLHRFRPDWPNSRLWPRPNRRTLVAHRQLTGLSCRFFLRFLGRLAARDTRRLIFSVPSFSIFFRNRGNGWRVSFIRGDAKRPEPRRMPMTDPRFTDPDPRLSDPVVRRDDNAGGMWGWIAGVAVLVLIGFLIVAGWKNNGTTASSGASPSATLCVEPLQCRPREIDRAALQAHSSCAPAGSRRCRRHAERCRTTHSRSAFSKPMS